MLPNKVPIVTMPIKATPYQHQIDAFNFVCEKFGLPNDATVSPGAALLMEMGTGKTITTISIIGALYQTGKIKRVLIVTPLSITGVWQQEFRKVADFDYNAVILDGSIEKKLATLKRLTGTILQVVILNYESAWRIEKELLKYDADIIVADEGHKIKTHTAKQSKSLHKFGAKAQYKMLLTGTVITNKAVDVFSQYKFIDPTVFGQSFHEFSNKYFYGTGFENRTLVLKKSMEQELMDKLHSIAFRTTKAECLDLPDITDVVRYVELEHTASKVYKALVKDSFAELSKGEVTITNVLTKLLRLSQLTGGFIGNDDSVVTSISTTKLDALSDIIDEVVNEDKKLVVIARFTAEIKAIEKLLIKKKLEYSLIMGGVKDRDLQVEQFQNNPKIQVFIGQIATAGLGITLTAASTMVFYSMDYSMSNFEQTKARIHRVGQKNSCTYIYLTAKGTVDEKVLKALQTKADLARTLVDDYRSGENPFI